jgi:ATP-dependent protease Clp ATPase subunit
MMEGLLMDVMFEISDHAGETVIITKNIVLGKENPTFV